MATTKFKFGRYGLLQDPRGAHVTWTIGDRQYLGTVVDAYRNETRGCAMLKVRHFCGDMAPDVAASVVDVLVREFQNERGEWVS